MKLYRQFETQAELDAQYDVDHVVPEFAEIVESLLEKSAEARASLPHSADVAYGPTLDETLDVFVAERKDGRKPPILVFFHGGYWRQLTAKEFHFVALGLARAGVTTVIPTHSLCPKVTLDEITRQARAAVAWSARHARELGDAERLFVGGHSAGAHLSVMSLLTDWHGEYGLRSDVIAGAVAISGLYDLRPLPYTCVAPSLVLDAGTIQRQSPMLLELPRRAPPLFVSYGGAETAEFRRQSDEFFWRWRKHELPGKLWVEHGKNHFTAMTDLTDPNAPLTRAILDFVGG